jgi:hypothetical protein
MRRSTTFKQEGFQRSEVDAFYVSPPGSTR